MPAAAAVADPPPRRRRRSIRFGPWWRRCLLFSSFVRSLSVVNIFSLQPGAALKTLYTFTGGSDDAKQNATLLYANGLLYGTTDAGGSGDDGTVFKISPTGTAKAVLHRFSGGIDGSVPEAGVIDVNGAIFGTTECGGSGSAFDDGTVDKLPL